jgi:hypothetical protein
MTIRPGALVAAIALCSALAVSAHHGQAGLFDTSRTIELKGTVKQWRFSNPHPILILEAADEKGARIDWDVYFGPGAVSSLRRQGFSADTFKTGETLVVIGNPATAGTAGVDVSSKGASVTRADGRRAP